MAKRSSVIELVMFAALMGAGLMAHRSAAQTFDGNGIVATTSTALAERVEAQRAAFEADPFALYELVDELLLPRFDLNRGSRGILARHWETASAEERARFVEAFYNYLVASYGTALIHFEHDTLRVLPFEGDPNTSPARVKTILTMSDGTEVNVDFVMIGAADDWKVVDVVAEGVSYVRTYRSQFSVDIATDGLGEVLTWLEEKGARRFRPEPSQ